MGFDGGWSDGDAFDPIFLAELYRNPLGSCQKLPFLVEHTARHEGDHPAIGSLTGGSAAKR
jgi:hypothetical protein